jgi:T4 RnlA family RNA ligase
MHIRDLEHLRSNPMIKFKEEEVDGEVFTIVAYMIGDKELWDHPGALETRGNTYDDMGDCVSAAFPKFFNVNERPDTAEHLIREKFVEVYDKRDGSMILPVLVNGEVRLKTKKSFYSDVAVLASQLIPDNVLELCNTCLWWNYTPIFEFTHPDCQIVLEYPVEENFVLLAIRDNITGEYYEYEPMVTLAETYGVHVIQRRDMTWDQLKWSIENDTGIEGYVLVLDDGRRVKFKTKWYLRMHVVMTELRARDVALAVVEETIDDIKSLVVSEGKDLDPLIEIENQVADELSTLRNQVQHISFCQSGKSVKEVAIDMKNHPLFSLIMSSIRGKEPNYKEYWVRNYLKQYPLRCVYNVNFSSQGDEHVSRY